MAFRLMCKNEFEYYVSKEFIRSSTDNQIWSWKFKIRIGAITDIIIKSQNLTVYFWV